MKKRDIRIKRELSRHGSNRVGHGWAARQAARRRGKCRSVKKRRA